VPTTVDEARDREKGTDTFFAAVFRIRRGPVPRKRLSVPLFTSLAWTCAAVASLAILLLGGLCLPTVAQSPVIYQCPMDPDVRSNKPGICPRCGMELVAGIPDDIEYPMDLAMTPRNVKPGETARLQFTIRNPFNGAPVKDFEIVHEKLFHLFVVSQDLKFFAHQHPEPSPSGTFTYDMKFPQPGLFRVLADVYPEGGTPQLIAKSIIIPGTPPAPVKLERDYSPKQTENMQVEIRTEPPQPLAGMRTMIYMKVGPVEGFEQYLGAWAHMLVSSDDLIDLIHTHPYAADGGPQLEFAMTFPRARTYRIWVQFQRKGVVNTARFDVPVEELK